MSISIEQIKDLREATGVSMMACKKALSEAGGDFDAAVTILRKKGEAKAADKSSRTVSEGAVIIKEFAGRVAMLILSCETDFMARNADFLALGDLVADKLLSGEISPEQEDIDFIKEAVLKLGENIQASSMFLIDGTGKNVGNYIHSNRKIGVLAVLDGGDDNLARDIAMHIAATNPSVISPDQISDDLVAKEKEIWADQLKNDGKPAEIIEKIMFGKEKKFREENALVKQSFVKVPEKCIEDLLNAANAHVVDFIRIAV